MDTIEKLRKYLRVLLDFDLSCNLLKQNFPDLLEDIISAKDNSDCSCNQRLIDSLIIKYQNNDKDRIAIEKIFSEYKIIKAIEAYDNFLEELRKKEERLYGKVHIIGKSSEDWNKFRNYLIDEKAKIASMSIIEKDNYLEVRLI